MKQEVSTKNAPEAIGAYSQAVKVEEMLFISGQLPINPKNSTIAPTIEEQTHQALKNLVEIVKEAGGNVENIVKCGIFIKDMNDFAKINEIYSKYFVAPYPARFIVEVARLPKEALIEIEATAIIS